MSLAPLSHAESTSYYLLQSVPGHALGLDLDSPPPQAAGYGLEYQQQFFEDLTGAGDLLAEDDEDDEEDVWGGAYLPAALEQARSVRVTSSSAPRSDFVSFLSTPSELTVGPESLPSWTLGDSTAGISPAGSPDTDFTASPECLGDRHLRALHISYETVSRGLGGLQCPELRGRMGEPFVSRGRGAAL